MPTEQRLEHLSGKIIPYKNEPLYQMDIQSLFNFKILINGCPVFSNFDQSPVTTRVNINPSILKAGKQKIEIELYPGYEKDGIQKHYLENGENFILKIEKTGWNKDKSLIEPTQVLVFKNNEQKIDFSKLTDYRTSLNFDASVPYTLQGWGNGEDLSQMDQKDLELKVVSFYNTIASALKEKDYDYLNTQFLNADTEWYQAEYFPKDIMTKFQTLKGRKGKSNASVRSDSEISMQSIYPIENYVMKLYGNNKMVRLEPKDGVHRGESLLRYTESGKNGMSRTTFIDMLLYIPKGAKSLQIIR
ncbi:hypothetical protein [Chryseobacterium jejuense]|uniref:hypothetical protein n=1 Tax=Chryseobacterium jejuense TaxID=445960 RepID=UPI001AE1E7AC|nr:hypothetical protein [Chryseobacterium jejuense]MBP2617617.1 hypothetical protein [Chryseobacterium jejuense]